MRKISIIVPIYNTELFLDACLNSILNQTYKNIEVLLIDDGSSDNSLKICYKYKEMDDRVIVIEKNNTGVSDSRNVGIKMSSGEYIAFIDSDDQVDKYYIEYLEKDIEHSMLNIVKKNNFNINVVLEDEKINYSKMVLEKSDFLLLANYHLLNPPWGRLYERQILIENKIEFDKHLSLGEDLLFNLEYMKYIDKIRLIDRKVYYYRLASNDSLSTKYRSDMEIIQLFLLEKFADFFKNYKEKHIKIYNAEIINFLSVIIYNELNNDSVGFIEKIKNSRSILSKKIIKQLLKEHKNNNAKLKTFVLRHKLLLLYYFHIKYRLHKFRC